MNLILDIGNTDGKYFVFSGGTILTHGREAGHALGFLPALAREVAPTAAILSSVVDLPAEAEARLRALPCPVLRFTTQTPIPLHNAYRTPQTLGTDRLAAAVGAWSLAEGHPLLVVDAGSCITFDLVTAEGEYLGGNISPGVQARLRAIDDYFPRLPRVEAEGPLPDLGYDTLTAIRAGVIQGLRHEIEGYVTYFKAKYPQLFVFLTGGDVDYFADPQTSGIFADRFLVPRGLNLVLEHQKVLE